MQRDIITQVLNLDKYKRSIIETKQKQFLASMAIFSIKNIIFEYKGEKYIVANSNDYRPMEERTSASEYLDQILSFNANYIKDDEITFVYVVDPAMNKYPTKLFMTGKEFRDIIGSRYLETYYQRDNATDILRVHGMKLTSIRAIEDFINYIVMNRLYLKSKSELLALYPSDIPEYFPATKQ